MSALTRNEPLPAPADPVCPPDNFNRFPPVEQVVGEWATTDGCNASPGIRAISADVELRLFAGCGHGAEIDFYVVADGGHTWPGSKLMEAISKTAAASIIGFTTDDIDATKLIWSFFKRFALEGDGCSRRGSQGRSEVQAVCAAMTPSAPANAPDRPIRRARRAC